MLALLQRPPTRACPVAAAVFSAMEQPDEFESLMKQCAFDPDSVKPKADFDFSPHMARKAKKQKKSAKEAEDEEGSQRLPKRLLLSAFSKQVGHRPTGLQTAQVLLFTERFPTEFREVAMQKIVLPKSQEGHPFVAPDGGLPCCALSTVNALRWLESHEDKLVRGDPKAVAQIKRIHEEGVQVEWIQVSSFVEWQLHVEGAAVQASVQVGAHILDTAIKYLSFMRGPFASMQGQSETTTKKELDAGFMALQQGKCAHRLRDAKVLLQSTETSVLVSLAQWRKQAHYLHANALPQFYFLTVPDWHQMRGKTAVVEGEEHKLQQLVATQVMRLVSEGEIINTGEVPKLRKSPTTIHVFKELCQVVLNGAKYKQTLEGRFCSVWSAVPAAERFFKRLLVTGEPSVVQSFLRALAVCDLGEKFEEVDPVSDLAAMVAKLSAAEAALKKAEGSQEGVKQEDVGAEAEGESGTVKADSQEPQQVAPKAKDSENSSSQTAPGPVVEPGKPSEVRQQSPEEDIHARLLGKARMALEETTVIYERCWKSGDPPPATLEKSLPGTLYVVPSPATSRGLPARAVSVLRGAGVGAPMTIGGEYCRWSWRAGMHSWVPFVEWWSWKAFCLGSGRPREGFRSACRFEWCLPSWAAGLPRSSPRPRSGKTSLHT